MRFCDFWRSTFRCLARQQACVLVLIFIVATASILHADTVELKGGDRLTGTAVKLEGGKLVFKTAYAADPIVIAWDQVTKLTVSKPMLLTTVKGKFSVSELAAEGKSVEAATEKGARTLAATDLKALRTPDDEAAYQKTLHPDWGHGWAVNADASFAMAQGNAKTESFGGNLSAARPTIKDKTTLHFTALYGRDRKQQVTTNDSTGGGFRYDRNESEKGFVFGSTDFLSNELQNLDLRSILSSGFGWHARKDKLQTLDLFGGGSWTHESYSASTSSDALVSNFASLNLGETLSRKLGKSSTLTEQYIFYPNLSTPGDYQFQLTSSLKTQIGKRLSWHVSFTDNYTSTPPTGTEANDSVFTTGIGITLARP